MRPHGTYECAIYIAKFDEAVWIFFSLLGLTATYLRENKRGMVALEQHINYYKEVLAGDAIYIETEVVEIKEKTIRIKHTMFNLESKQRVSETTVTGLHIYTELRRGIALPGFVSEHIERLLNS